MDIDTLRNILNNNITKQSINLIDSCNLERFPRLRVSKENNIKSTKEID